jgi:hypothetical protein
VCVRVSDRAPPSFNHNSVSSPLMSTLFWVPPPGNGTFRAIYACADCQPRRPLRTQRRLGPGPGPGIPAWAAVRPGPCAVHLCPGRRGHPNGVQRRVRRRVVPYVSMSAPCMAGLPSVGANGDCRPLDAHHVPPTPSSCSAPSCAVHGHCLDPVCARVHTGAPACQSTVLRRPRGSSGCGGSWANKSQQP